MRRQLAGFKHPLGIDEVDTLAGMLCCGGADDLIDARISTEGAARPDRVRG